MISKKKTSVLLIVITILVVAFSGCTSTTSTEPATSSDVSTASPSQASDTIKNEETEKVELIVSAAASLTHVAAEITNMYKTVAPNVTLTYTFGSSGALQTQIEEGAPSDIFMSAAKKQMTALEGKGLIQEGTNKELLLNEVVLITPKDSKKGILSFKDAASDKVSKIALGEPSSVPVGQYSEEIFMSLGILDKVKAKSNYGSDVRQILTWVESGEVDCGVVYATDAAASDKIKIVCEAPKNSHKPVIYPVAILKSSKHLQVAQAFLDFLQTSEVATIFEKYGFKINK